MEKEKKVTKETKRHNEAQVGVSSGKPLRVLSTSLGLLLAANMLLMPEAADAAGESAANNADQPKLVEWSTDSVKAYFDPNVDWNIPYPVGSNTSGSAAVGGTAVANGTGGGNTTIIREGGGFGWDDLLLYHLIFNSGRSYSTSAWDSSRPVVDNRTNQPYKPKSFDSETFRNQPTAGSTVRPTTSSKSGTFTTRNSGSTATKAPTSSSTKPSSSSPGSIGGKSSGFSSSTSHSSGISFGG